MRTYSVRLLALALLLLLSLRPAQAADIAAISSLTIKPVTSEMYRTWRQTPRLLATTEEGTVDVPASEATWSSSNTGVARVDASGLITARSAGIARITARYAGARASFQLRVLAPALRPEHEPIDPALATPAPDSLYVIPIVIIRYLPTIDGEHLDVSYAPDFYEISPMSLGTLKEQIDTYDRRVKFMLEEGTRFRGYQDPSARPSIGYRVVDYITIYEPTPPGPVLGMSGEHPIYSADMHQIFERFDAQDYVEDQGVKEFWLWTSGFDASYPSYDPAIHKPDHFRQLIESNMASPTTGDISNSYRDNSDLPIYESTYVVYQQNFRRSQAEAVHNRGHQLESILSYVNERQDGNIDLFWKKFVGRDDSFIFVPGRSGDTHHPPNARDNYDYHNPDPVESDIEDWTPEGIGRRKPVNVDTWGGIPYAWPDPPADGPNKTESQWYIYWMQNMPGEGNTIPYGPNRMTNWWTFTADWDASITAGLGLYEPINLLANPGFELDENHDGYPDSWTKEKGISRSGERVRSGDYAMRIGPTKNKDYTISQAVKDLSAGATYALVGYVNYAGVFRDDFTINIQVRWLDGKKRTIDTYTVPFYGQLPDEWNQAVDTLVAPPKTASAKLRIVIRDLDSQGTVYLDDFELREQAAPATTITAPLAPSQPHVPHQEPWR